MSCSAGGSSGGSSGDVNDGTSKFNVGDRVGYAVRGGQLLPGTVVQVAPQRWFHNASNVPGEVG